jgi:hypothetical protein
MNVLVFSALTNNMVHKIAHFQFRCDLEYEEYTNLSWFRPLHGGNSHTSSGFMLMETYVTKGEHSARLVHV